MIDSRAQLDAWITQRAKKIGMPARPEEDASLDVSDYRALLQDVADRATRMLDGHGLVTGITTQALPNAWAGRDALSSHLHAVVASKGLIRHIHQLTTAAHNATLEALFQKATPDEFRALWGVLPKDAAHAAGFARLLSHVAFVLLVHHELAHIVIGHAYFTPTHGVEPVDEREALLLSAGPSVENLPSVPESVLLKQAFETDADMHALLWTDDYLLSFDPDKPILDALDAPTKAVHVAVCGREPSRRFVLVTASWVLFTALGGTLPTVEELAQGSHPPVGMRLALALLQEYDLASQRDPSAQRLDVAAAFGTQIVAHRTKPRPSFDEVVERNGYKQSMGHWNALMSHHDRMAALRKRYDSVLRPVRLPSKLPEMIWWKAKPEPFAV